MTLAVSDAAMEEGCRKCVTCIAGVFSVLLALTLWLRGYRHEVSILCLHMEVHVGGGSVSAKIAIYDIIN